MSLTVFEFDTVSFNMSQIVKMWRLLVNFLLCAFFLIWVSGLCLLLCVYTGYIQCIVSNVSDSEFWKKIQTLSLSKTNQILQCQSIRSTLLNSLMVGVFWGHDICVPPAIIVLVLNLPKLAKLDPWWLYTYCTCHVHCLNTRYNLGNRRCAEDPKECYQMLWESKPSLPWWRREKKAPPFCHCWWRSHGCWVCCWIAWFCYRRYCRALSSPIRPRQHFCHSVCGAHFDYVSYNNNPLINLNGMWFIAFFFKNKRFDKRITTFAEEKFQRDGIELRTGYRVVKVSDKDVTMKSHSMEEVSVPYGMVVWSTGIASRPVIRDFMNEIGQGKRRVLETNEWLRVPQCDTVYAIGDCATISQRKIMVCLF